MTDPQVSEDANFPSEPNITDSSAVDSLLDSVIAGETTKPTEPSKSEEPAPVSEPEEAPKIDPEPTEPKEGEQPATEAPKEDHDDEIDGIKFGRGTNPNNEGVRSLRGVAKKYKTEANQYKSTVDQLKAHVQELTTKVSQPAAIDPAVQQEVQQLRAFRTLYDLQNDPTFRAAFDDKINMTEGSMMEMLKSHGLAEDDLKLIKDAGGILNYKWPDGTSMVDSEWWQKEVMSKLPFSDQKKLEKLLTDAMLLKDQKDKAVNNMSQNREKFEADKQKFLTEAVEKETNFVKEKLEEFSKRIPWVKEQQIPTNATPEQKAQIQADNAFYKKAELIFENAYNPKDLNQKFEAAAAAVMSFKQAELLEQRDRIITNDRAEIKRLTDEISALKSAGKTNTKTPIVQTKQSKTSTPQERIHMKDDAAVEAGLREVGA